MPLRQTSQDSYTGRMTDFDAREPILPAFRATNETNGHSPFEDEERVSPNHEFSHLFQSSHPDEDQQSSSHSTVLGGSGGSNGLELKAGFARGVTLSDTGAVPDSMGAMRRVDRPTHSNLPPFSPTNINRLAVILSRHLQVQMIDLPSPPGFTTIGASGGLHVGSGAFAEVGLDPKILLV
ncbi:Chitin synthase, class 3 [Puccinia graminis f. sp. tritici]|uniref:Chitin synthase, class 3 n=1 Tax=Puccinia graminis f. sp. tritici TaxID=56615 RepID=A0A5B0NFK7_PUCGR|nr:Chitin synthase, class 3 [Puccinia graminis f. sp. tritici]